MFWLKTSQIIILLRFKPLGKWNPTWRLCRSLVKSSRSVWVNPSDCFDYKGAPGCRNQSFLPTKHFHFNGHPAPDCLESGGPKWSKGHGRNSSLPARHLLQYPHFAWEAHCETRNQASRAEHGGIMSHERKRIVSHSLASPCISNKINKTRGGQGPRMHRMGICQGTGRHVSAWNPPVSHGVVSLLLRLLHGLSHQSRWGNSQAVPCSAHAPVATRKSSKSLPTQTEKHYKSINNISAW